MDLTLLLLSYLLEQNSVGFRIEVSATNLRAPPQAIHNIA